MGTTLPNGEYWFSNSLENHLNLLFTIIADGNAVGCTVAPSPTIALQQAISTLTRKTWSQEDLGPGYETVAVVRLRQNPDVMNAHFVTRLLASLARVNDAASLAEMVLS